MNTIEIMSVFAPLVMVAAMLWTSRRRPNIALRMEQHPFISGGFDVVLSNHGDASISDLKFQCNEAFPWWAQGLREEDVKKPKYLLTNFCSISHLAPHEQVRMYWGQWGGIEDHLSGRTITIKYKHSWTKWRVLAKVNLDVLQPAGATMFVNDPLVDLCNEMKNLAEICKKKKE